MRKRIVIVGARHRGWTGNREEVGGNPRDRALLTTLIAKISENDAAYIVTMGTDAGFGALVKEVALREGVGFADIAVRASDLVPKGERELLYIARHAALLDIGEEFHIFPDKRRLSQITDLIQRLDAGRIPYILYTPEE